MFPYYNPQNLFFADVLNKLFTLKDVPYLIFPVLSLLLIWRISRYLFRGNVSLIPPLIFILSPWGWYLTFAHSIYIIFLFLILTIIYGVILIRSDEVTVGNLLIAVATLIAAYSSLIFFFLMPISLLILIIIRFLSLKNLKLSIILIILAYIPLTIMIKNNPTGFINHIAKEIQIFSDPGLINTVNRYQGAASSVGLNKLARISENKYLFYSEYFALKDMNQLIPTVFFTSQYKLLGFSFSPPIFLGFLVPFIYGLYLLLQKSAALKTVIASTILVIPSVLSANLVSLNRLIIFMPVVIFIISHGLVFLFEHRSDKIKKFFLVITLLLVLFQFVVTMGDIRSREQKRFEAYFGSNYQLTEP